jgi:hypothetical protein
MTQLTSSGWAGAVTAPFRQLNYSVAISFSLATTSGINYFTIGTSTIGGNDIIKSGGSTVAFFDQYAYTDYSKYVMSVDVKRSIGQYPYGTFMAQADIEMDNSSNLFLPGFDRTIGSGILPNRPVKIGIGLFGEYMNQFTGFMGQPDITLTQRVAQFHAFDAFNTINGFMSTASGAKVSQYAQNIIASLLGEMGFGVGQYVLDQSLQTPIGYCATYGLKAGDIIQSLAEAEQALAFIDENGIFRFWNRQHFTTTSGTIAFNLNYSSASEIQYENTPIINDVTVVANPRAVQGNQKIWELGSYITLLPGQSTLYIASFSDSNGALPVTGIDTPVTLPNSSTSYFVANTQSDGSGIDMAGSMYIQSAYSYGNQYWVTFYNNSSSTIYITQMGLYGTPAKVTAQINQQYIDQQSVNTYGRNPANNGVSLVISNDFIQDASAANSLCRTLVYEYKDAHKRYIVPVAANSNPALQIGDYGKLTIEETGEVKTVWIVGKEEQIDRNGVYTQTLELEERAIQTYFTIGVSTIGGSDAIAP